MKSLSFALTLALAANAFAHRGSTFLFATIPPSPAANGRAGVLFGPEHADPLAAWANPGLLGLMATTQYASASFYPERTRWLPGFNLSDLTFSARGVFASWPHKPKAGESSWLPLGIAYTERYLDLGETQRTGINGQVLGTFHSYERVRSLHFGLSQQSRLWRFGAGTGVNYAYSNLNPISDGLSYSQRDAKGVSVDLGLWFDNDAVEFARRLFKRDIPENLFLRPSLGFAVTNIGFGVSYDSRIHDDPQPRTARITMGIAAGIQIKHPDGLPWHMLTLNVAAEADDELVKRDRSSDYSYQFPPGDINPLKDLLLGQRNDRVHQKKAFELSVFEMVFIRGGSEIDDWYTPMTIRYSGWGFSVRGLMRLASHGTVSGDIAWFARHIDLQYHESKEAIGSSDHYSDDYSTRDGTTYKGISLTYVR